MKRDVDGILDMLFVVFIATGILMLWVMTGMAAYMFFVHAI